ncbi:hypothetical protein GCM10012284_35590 [Mangrovihabitans endophyticus]|uniref:Neprosin PEP catalytic domain-containing protein n=2 Tax=Mangrovihabitans endophyticus TaxID=1751298 RepID=A0A8J3C243_9ACTN|nr:hypothetical protein GCM10012284_35590 [Mangrovihabitans endophyticus]
MGVAWTFNAGAEEIPASARTATTADGTTATVDDKTVDDKTVDDKAADRARDETDADESAVDDGPADGTAAAESTPPAKLPWGARPRRMKIARAGASSAAVAAAGADGARADTSGSRVAAPEYSPKGYTSRFGTLGRTKTTVQPPAPPVSGLLNEPTTNAATSVNFFYSSGSQYAPSDGTYANLVIGRPFLAREDYHTLAEIAVQSADGKQIVEVGWNVDRSVNGDEDPHLFVYHWVDRQETCYNGCGFVQYSTTFKPGDTLPTGVSKRFGVQYFNGAWWIAYDSEWIGYFPGGLWGGKYDKSGLIQWFGEVAASSTKPCTDMGTGAPAGSEDAARVGSVSLINGPDAKMNVKATASEYYGVNPLSDRTMRYGGAGAC